MTFALYEVQGTIDADQPPLTITQDPRSRNEISAPASAAHKVIPAPVAVVAATRTKIQLPTERSGLKMRYEGVGRNVNFAVLKTKSKPGPEKFTGPGFEALLNRKTIVGREAKPPPMAGRRVAVASLHRSNSRAASLRNPAESTGRSVAGGPRWRCSWPR